MSQERPLTLTPALEKAVNELKETGDDEGKLKALGQKAVGRF
jgi:hypothetical protein